MRAVRALPIVTLALLAAASPAWAEQSTGAVVLNAQVGSRTSLKVSARVLEFEVAHASQPATAVVEFSAGARLANGGEVVLSVEPLHAIDGPGGAADVETALSFTGEGAGTLAGNLGTSGLTAAGRWIGSGAREGRLVFSLRAAAPGHYSVPVRLVLSTP